MPFPPKKKKPAAKKTADKVETPPAATPNMRGDGGGVIPDERNVPVDDTLPEPVQEFMTTPTGADGTEADGPPVQADGTVTMSVDELNRRIDDKVQEAVRSALRLAAIEAKSNGTPVSERDDDAFAIKVASAVAMAMAANQNQQANLAHATELERARQRQRKIDKCSICGQALSACGGPWIREQDVAKLDPQRQVYYGNMETIIKDRDGYILDVEGKRMEEPGVNHVKTCVFPKDDINAEYFTGVRINGKVYLSNGPGHEIWVPKHNNIAAILSDFENGERRLRTPRRQVRPYGGTVSANGGVTHQVPQHFIS